MNDEKRKCIFTGKPADFNKTVSYSEIHNWAKKVPCTREWWGANNDRPLNKLEFKLVELFYEQELAKLKASNIETQMADLRDKMTTKKGIEPDFIIIDDPDIPLPEEVFKIEAGLVLGTIMINTPNKKVTEEPEDVKVEKDDKEKMWE